MRHITIASLLFCFSCMANGFCQTPEKRQTIDSLINVVNSNTADTTRAVAYSNLAFEYVYYATDSLRYYAQKGIELSEDLNFDKGRAYNLNMLARVAENDNNFPLAISRQRKAIDLFENQKDSLMLAGAYYNIGAIYLRVRNIDSARIALEKALAITKGSRNSDFLANIYYSLGNLYKAQLQFDMAITNYALALETALRENDKDLVANAYGGMAQIYFSTDEKQKAIKSYLKAIAIFRETGNEQNMAVLLSNLGGVYYDVKQYEDSERVLEEALVIKRKIGRNRSTVFTLGALGNLYTDTRQFEKARSYYLEALSLLSPDDQQARFRILYAIGKLDYDSDKTETSSSFFQQAYEIQQKVSILPSEVVELYQTMSKLEAKKANYKRALAFNEKAQVLQDSLQKNQNTNELNELKTKFDVLEKERQIAALDAENQKQLLNAEKARKERLLFIISSIGFALLAFALYSRYKTKQKLSTQLQLALNEKEILLKEIHHRVKNNLQLVLSLLNIQARELKNDEVNEFLKKGEARIASMALIHQTLYTNDDLSKVNIKEYTKDLLHSIFQSFGLENNHFNYVIDTEDLNFDIQTAVPLGLIINELACNALKHAFANRTEGMLKIELKNLGKSYELKVSDDGIGMKTYTSNQGSIGLELVSILSEQLDGTMKMEVDKGTTFTIIFNEISKAA